MASYLIAYYGAPLGRGEFEVRASGLTAAQVLDADHTAMAAGSLGIRAVVEGAVHGSVAVTKRDVTEIEASGGDAAAFAREVLMLAV